MKLKTLEIEGFRSFCLPQALDLTKVPPGLYLLAGENKVEPDLQGNGAGKSSLLEAVYWALFGKTSRNLKAGAVRNWSAKTCQVQLTMEEGVVYRSWSPNQLTWDDVVVDQETLEGEIGLTPEVALSTFYFAQFSPFFIDLQPSARMELYSSVLGLDLWEIKSDQAKAYAVEAEKAAQRLEVEHGKLLERASTLLGMDYSAAIGEWNEKQANKITALERSLKNLDKDIAALAKEHDKRAAAVAKAQRDFKEFGKALQAAEAETKKARAASISAEVAAAQANQALAAKSASLTRFIKHGEGECETCGQSISKAYSTKHKDHLTEEVEALSIAAKAAIAAKTKAQQALAASEAREKEIVAESPNLHALEKHVAVSQAELEGLNKRKFTAAKEIAAAKKEVNPFLAQVEDNKKKAAAAKAEATAKEKELAEARTLAAHLTFWVKGFKDVRFQVMQESLAQLNAEANECLHQLGLQDWALEFVFEKETKSGTVKRGFTCLVHSPYTEEAMPWEVWSGGESQRLRLAAQLGVSNMLSSRMGREFDVEFWDEPSNWLSPSGIEQLLAVLQDRAERYGRRIFLADHRSFSFDFDGVLTIVKDEQGSHIEEIQ